MDIECSTKSNKSPRKTIFRRSKILFQGRTYVYTHAFQSGATDGRTAIYQVTKKNGSNEYKLFGLGRKQIDIDTQRSRLEIGQIRLALRSDVRRLMQEKLSAEN